MMDDAVTPRGNRPAEGKKSFKGDRTTPDTMEERHHPRYKGGKKGKAKWTSTKGTIVAESDTSENETGSLGDTQKGIITEPHDPK